MQTRTNTLKINFRKHSTRTFAKCQVRFLKLLKSISIHGEVRPSRHGGLQGECDHEKSKKAREEVKMSHIFRAFLHTTKVLRIFFMGPP